jgi:hypothetical protein
MAARLYLNELSSMKQPPSFAPFLVQLTHSEILAYKGLQP